jgi:hypothetical protein
MERTGGFCSHVIYLYLYILTSFYPYPPGVGIESIWHDFRSVKWAEPVNRAI